MRTSACWSKATWSRCEPVITGTHTGHYAGAAPTGNPIQTSACHIFRVRDDQFTEHWQVTDTYRILAAIGAIPGVANVFQKQVLGVPESPGGLFAERPGTEFGRPAGRRVTREESRAVVRRLYDGVISTGRAEDAGMAAIARAGYRSWTEPAPRTQRPVPAQAPTSAGSCQPVSRPPRRN
jgi:hypothetical protein